MLLRCISRLFAILAMVTASLASDIMVISAHAPASLTPTAKSAAVYMAVMNHGAEPDVLLSITTRSAEHASPHETLNQDGVMKMRAVERLELKPQETVTFEPGGLHIMLTGLRAPLKEGEQLSLELTFEKAGVVKVDVPVVGKLGPAASTAHEHTDE